MANFHVGQRVKKVSHRHKADFIGREHITETTNPLGTEGTVSALSGPFGEIGVIWDGGDSVWCLGYMLAPILDPNANAFLERIKKLGKEPINDAPKVTVTK